MKIVPDTTFKDDDENINKQKEELDEYTSVTKKTQEMIDASNNKIIAARNRLNQIHDSHWQQYITKVNQALADARNGALSHYELRDRIMEIDNEYWDYFNNVEIVNFWKEMAKAEIESEAQYEIYREEYIQRLTDTIKQIKEAKLSLNDGRIKLQQYSTAYSFILKEVIDFSDTRLNYDKIEALFNSYKEKYQK